MSMKYEFFSWRGFAVGALVIGAALILQSIIGFPQIWIESPVAYSFFIAVSMFIVGFSSGSVLIFLFPPDQDVIGIAGLGSDDITQHMALFLVILALIQPLFSGFVFFFDYFGQDPFAVIWVIVGFAAPSAGFTAAMYDRTHAIASDLRIYFSHHRTMDLVTLDWLHGLGPRTAVYRMGMLENAAQRIDNVRIRGHELVREADPYPINPPEE